MRSYERFAYKDAALRFSCPRPEAIRSELVRQRTLLEQYIALQPEFASSLEPLELLPQAPPIARVMAEAARLTGVGPMAAVAGAMAQACAEAALAAGALEAIVENGGDLYLASPEEVVVGLFAGDHPLSGRLALRIAPGSMPVAVCSSSSYLGHSLSLGECDLATVAAADAALADAAATLAGNLVRSAEDVEPTLERITAIPGIQGVLIVKDRRVGLAGSFPELIRVRDPRFVDKITGDFRRPKPGAAAGGARETDRGGPLLEPRGGFRLPG